MFILGIVYISEYREFHFFQFFKLICVWIMQNLLKNLVFIMQLSLDCCIFLQLFGFGVASVSFMQITSVDKQIHILILMRGKIDLKKPLSLFHFLHSCRVCACCLVLPLKLLKIWWEHLLRQTSKGHQLLRNTCWATVGIRCICL